MVSYIDTLLELNVQDVGRKLLEDELVSLCSEFLFIGTDTSTAAMQWVMANLVKHQDIQEKVYFIFYFYGLISIIFILLFHSY